MDSRTQKLEKQVQKSASVILKDYPFFSAATVQTPKLVSESEQTASFGSDGLIRIGLDYGLSITGPQLVGLLAQALGHRIFDHHTRKHAEWDPAIYNLAADCVLNWILKQAGFSLPPGGTEDAPHLHEFLNRTRGWSVEQVYHALIRENLGPEPEPQPEPQSEPGTPDESGSDDSDETAPDETPDESGADGDSSDGDGNGETSGDGPARPWGWVEQAADEDGEPVVEPPAVEVAEGTTLH